MRFACDETVTLVRHVKQTNTDEYTCYVIAGVSWFGKRGIRPGESGEAPTCEYTVRIPEELLPQTQDLGATGTGTAVLPQPGDLIVRGVLAQYAGRQCLTGREAFQIASVGDNRRGAFLRHVAVRSV